MAVARWKTAFETELGMAEAARAAGNEGRARVCARRAAGIVAGEYFRQRGLANPGSSAFDRLKLLSTLPDLPPGVQEMVAHFLVRITPEHILPMDADLIAEASWLESVLLNAQT